MGLLLPSPVCLSHRSRVNHYLQLNVLQTWLAQNALA